MKMKNKAFMVAAAFVIVIIAAAAIIFCYVGVENSSPTVEADGCYAKIVITNEIPDRLKGIALSYGFRAEPAGSVVMENADGSLLEKGDIEFEITEDDIPKGADLSDFYFIVRIREKEGDFFDLINIDVPLVRDEEYRFNLLYADGIYSVFKTVG